MRRHVLLDPVTMTGRGAFGGEACLTLVPVDHKGIFWHVDGVDVPLHETRISAHRYFHYLALFWGLTPLRVPEHLLGILLAMGVDGVSIHSSRLPYDGCAKAFEEVLNPHHAPSILHKNGVMAWYTPEKMVEVRLKTGRSLQFFPDDTAQTLSYKVTVDYHNAGRCILRGSLDKTDIRQLATSRPYGRTVFHKMLSGFLGRTNQFVWFASENHSKGLEEIARHRLLDLLGALAHVTPPGGTLVGEIRSPAFANHGTDMELIKGLLKVGLRKLS